MRDKERTKAEILNVAFELIYQNGYHATSIDSIMEKTGVTKGTLFYYFKNKELMTIKMIDGVLRPRLSSLLFDPLKYGDDPIESIITTIQNAMMGFSDFEVKHGCPLNNLIQEMGASSPRIKKALQKIINDWKEHILVRLREAVKSGIITSEIDVDEVADYIISGYEGSRGTGKVHNGKKLYAGYLRQLRIYLEALSKS
jgi:TetR/AcrR family transcriptional repressor of nem operon